MYYMPKERIDIGRRAFTHELSKEDAARKYEVSVQSIINYVKDYMKENRISVILEAADTLDIRTPNYSKTAKDQSLNELTKNARLSLIGRFTGRTKKRLQIIDYCSHH